MGQVSAATQGQQLDLRKTTGQRKKQVRLSTSTMSWAAILLEP
jgi:hypothetical protein